ncbi:hypothetical protein BV898_00167 [Hypsibius exemplaris]|uniref:Uncharacterized protein n=1 Tax=Hypsibius exemplaris TaxID=2072580 RepID=A0A1W0XF00_HYPEX|nr:hypothetical protein BV898_00167 [Hypsibius exemplaris]
MYSGSLNVSSGGSNYRRRKTQRGRRPSEKPPTATVEDPALLMPGQFGSVQYWARRFYLCLRKIVFGVSDGYGEYFAYTVQLDI